MILNVDRRLNRGFTLNPKNNSIIRTKEKSKGAFAYERKNNRAYVNGIKVTSHIPEDVSESFKQNKINQIYDILVAADKRIDKADKPESEKTA